MSWFRRNTNNVKLHAQASLQSALVRGKALQIASRCPTIPHLGGHRFRGPCSPLCQADKERFAGYFSRSQPPHTPKYSLARRILSSDLAPRPAPAKGLVILVYVQPCLLLTPPPPPLAPNRPPSDAHSRLPFLLAVLFISTKAHSSLPRRKTHLPISPAPLSSVRQRKLPSSSLDPVVPSPMCTSIEEASYHQSHISRL